MAMSGPRGGRVKTTSDLLFANFNQENTSVSVGTRRGYSISHCEPFKRTYIRTDGAAAIVEMLFDTSLVAVVGTGDKPSSSPRKLNVVNIRRQNNLCEYTYSSAILSVKLNRRRLIVVIEGEIHIYDISNMKHLHTLKTTPDPQAICALSPSSENNYLVYPSPSISSSAGASQSGGATASMSSRPSGDVTVYDALTLSITNIIQAHKSPLAFLSVNQSGTLLATASDKGTVVRVFSIPNGEKVAQFRRGTYPARIYSISFNAVSSLLCVSSNNDTVHIFKLARDRNRQGDSGNDDGSDGIGSSTPSLGRFYSHDGSNGGYEAYIDAKRNEADSTRNTIRRKSLTLGKSVAGSVGGYLPQSLTELWEPQRDFAFLKLPSAGVKSIVALSDTSPQVYVVTSEGIFYSYAIDLEYGGECILQKSRNLLEGFDEQGGNTMD